MACSAEAEPLTSGVVREVREETGLTVEPVELVELLDRISRDGERVRYHYVIADYLCRVVGWGTGAASDADAVRWVERAEWNSHSALRLDPVTRSRHRGRLAESTKSGSEFHGGTMKRFAQFVVLLLVVLGAGFGCGP